MTPPIFVADHISKKFVDGRPLQALLPVSFQIEAGEIVCLVGPSGSGKSTLLRIMGGLMASDGGAMWFAGQPHRAPNPAIGFVFQKTNLMPWRTVLQNILLPLEVQQKKVTDADQGRATALLAAMGLGGFEEAYPRQLSGGMNQRVVLARTLLQHSITEAVLLADRIFVLSERPGRLAEQVVVGLPRPRTLAMINTPAFGAIALRIRGLIGEHGEREAEPTQSSF
ncbi:MAG: ATP-binding cassette domain-containing protein [Caldilinea sp.]|nr:ATP-binding cassette domain-containing protein [Caldilinea sp.]